jgi:hypothetical protein
MFYKVPRRAILTAAIILLLAHTSSGQAGIRVDEAAARIQIQPEGSVLALVVELPVENPSAQALQTRMVVELVDPRGVVQSHADRDVSLHPGPTTLKIPLPSLAAGKSRNEENGLLWYRLRYSLTPLPPATPPAKPLEGIISAGEITPQLFDLHVAGAGLVRAGSHTSLRVRATHPMTGRPVARVTVQASLDIESDDGKPLVTRKAVTGRDGLATLELTVPKDLAEDDNAIDVTVTGTLGGLSAQAEGNLPVYRAAFGSLSTDKPLYQPGQTLHMRLMAFGDDKKALADQPVTIEIKDPDDTVQYAAHFRTSRFGIAAADWPIPENLRLGNYRIRGRFDDDRYQSAQGFASVKISRYELPTFTVAAKPDHSYYLPGHNAEVEVRADYLFGKPVSHGHVRLVREDRREWNYREQKWDIEEGAAYEGDTDANGRFVAHLDLTKDHDELAGNDYQRFRDISLAAYFTDSSTRRTEQRRFDLRLTKHPIHVYIITDSYRLVSTGLPVEFFVSTDYADGSPAPCDVLISWVAKPWKNAAGAHTPWELPLRRVHTDRYGLAKVSGLKVPDDPDSADAFLSFHATDRKGVAGDHSEGLEYSDDPVIRVATDKTLYRPDEPINVTLTSNQRNMTVFVDALVDYRVITSQILPMRGGRASLVLPPNEKFQDPVTIFAYGLGYESGNIRSVSAFSGSHTVLFPKKHDLQLDVRPEKSTYRPGDEATVNFRVAGPEGESLESALGLVVVDKALEERQRSDEDFGQAWGFYGFRRLYGDDEGFKGIRRRDLDKLDLSQPLPEGLELVAEVLLRGGAMYHSSFESDSGRESLRQVFAAQMDPQILSLTQALAHRYEQTGEYPKSLEALRSDLASAAGIEFDKLRDPWGQPYKAAFSVSGPSDVLAITSAGPDKKFGTDDDFEATRMAWPYFKPHADAIQKAVDAFHTQTGGYIRDLPALKAELKREGSDLDSWKDPWGHPYRYTFGVAATEYTVAVTSAGPDGRFSSLAAPSEDDFALSTARVDYTLELQNQVGRALTLARYGEKSQTFPQSEEELKKALQAAGIAWESLKDAWGHRYYATFRQDAMYADSFTVESYEDLGQSNPQHTQIVPVTKQMNWVYIRSAGPDGIEGTADDFTVAVFSRALLEQSGQEKTPVAPRDQSILTGAMGAISGTVTDETGAVIPGAEATARNLTTNQPYTAKSGNDGKFILRNLPPGFYSVAISSRGFKTYAITDVPVWSSNITPLDVILRVGVVTQTVEVQAAPVQLQTQSAMAVANSKPGLPSIALHPAVSTPRLREYFPETLLWQPELVTDGKGHAQVKFPLAGSITTWKLAAVASSLDGEIGTAEKEIRAFQPFFIEHDPPRYLTVGDQIDLPVVLRNYLDHPLRANVEMSAQNWFSLASPAQSVEIAANDSAGQVFRFTAVAPVKQGKQRVTARSNDVADAIEKTVTVHPDGQEKIQTLSQVFAEKAALDLPIPDQMIPGSLQTTLKIYPNLNAHVLESIEAIMMRPYGCAEQTISAAYPSILYLRYAEAGDKKNPELSARALKYVQLGYTRLLSYQAPDGGFSYWGRGEGDLALTAYALRFLVDARAYVAVDDSVVEETLSWLFKEAQPDGRWKAHYWGDRENTRASAELTAYIARVIAASKLTTGGDAPQAKDLAGEAFRAVNHALDYVQPRAVTIDEPYLIAAYTLAALDAGQDSRAAAGLERLHTLAHREGNTSYWSLEVNTPFFGWGIAGRVETTALVLQALEKGEARQHLNPGDDDLITRGWLFLLKNQDRYGCWYSTQASVNVLDAIGAFTAPRGNNLGAAATKAEILIDGRPAASLDLPADNQISGPVLEDLSPYLSPGTHRVEVRRPAGSSPTSLQIVADYYVPWTHPGAASDTHHVAGASDALRLTVHFDKESAKPGESVTCSVDAERIGFQGYGMMLAEIGLPPGAEVDRATLENAMTASGWDVDQYDILPDRVVVYLWPRAGGVKFSFAFKFRYGLKALATRSVLYDYYNPGAQAEVQPARFLVQ